MFFHNYTVQKLVILSTAKVCESHRTVKLVNLWLSAEGCKLSANYLTKSSNLFRIWITKEKISKRQNYIYPINIFNPKIRMWSLYIVLPSESTVLRILTVFLYTYVLM
jgi:hypothetical protein